MKASATLAPCPACNRSLGERNLRGLCRGCYFSGPIRSCFDSQGRQIADLPQPAAGAVSPGDAFVTRDPRAGEAADRPAAKGDDAPPPQPPPIVLTTPAGPQPRGPGQPRHTPAQAERLVLDALDAVLASRALSYTMPDGTRAASVSSVAARAGLPPRQARAAARRLVERGVLRWGEAMAGQAAVGGGFNQHRPVWCVARAMGAVT